MSGLSELSPNGGTMERLLLRELAHRVNNELASAISAVSMAEFSCNNREAKAALASVRHRLMSHTHVHHSLQMPDYTTTIELPAYLYQLCRAISQSKLESEGIGLSLSVYPLRMSSDRCWLLGMIVFELITNAARHAFCNGASSEIHLEVLPAGDSIACCITDNGVCEEPPSPGKGLSIVETLAATVHGSVDMQIGKNGTITVVNLPIVG